MDLLNTTRIREADELPAQIYQNDFCKEADLSVYRGSKMTLQQYTWVVNCFRTFQGQEEKAHTLKDIENIL